ncbi:unnamed protein product [Leuciscus chuanchicus]
MSSSSPVTHGCLYWSSILLTFVRKVKGDSSAGVFGVHVSFSGTVKEDSLRRANQRLDAALSRESSTAGTDMKEAQLQYSTPPYLALGVAEEQAGREGLCREETREAVKVSSGNLVRPWSRVIWQARYGIHFTKKERMRGKSE